MGNIQPTLIMVADASHADKQILIGCQLLIKYQLSISQTDQMMDSSPTIFTIDILPANCMIVAQVAYQSNGEYILLPPINSSFPPTHVRFCASKPDGSESEWSGWFDLLDIPIVLTWATFWDTDGW